MIERPLEIAGGREQHEALSVGDRKHRGFLTVQELLDDDHPAF